MLRELKKKSIEGLVSKYDTIDYETVEQICRNRKPEYTVAVQNAVNQDRILTIDREGQIWLLNSVYDPKKAAREWAEQYNNSEINDYGIFLIFGIGDGRAIRELLTLKPHCLFLIYEPSLDIFLRSIEMQNVSEILVAEQVCAVVKGINEQFFPHILQQILNYSNYQLVVQAVLPNYDSLFSDEYRKVLDTYLNTSELIVFTRNTEILRGIEIARNGYRLTKDILKQYSVSQLRDVLKQYDMQNMPAILVAAGPSLDKNVEELKRAKGRAFILAVDTALNTVLEHGILPDMTMSIDSRKPLVLFKHELAEKIPIALSSHSNVHVVKRNSARHFYEVDKESYLNRLFASVTGKEGEQLPTGGSVANNALSLLIEMGFQTIIFVGQDLAYPGGQEHTRQAYNSETDRVEKGKKDYIEVEDIYGNMVLTEANMNLYRKWIEAIVAGYPSIQMIDATEGGAKIHGTKIDTLHNCIDRFCTKQYEVNTLLENSSPFFSKEEQIDLKREILQIPEELQHLKTLVKEEKQLYQRLIRCNSAENIDELKLLFAQISRLNEQMVSLSISAAVRPYMAKESYEIEGKMFQYAENDRIVDQISDFGKLGEQLMEAYVEGIEKMKSDIPMIVQDFE